MTKTKTYKHLGQHFLKCRWVAKKIIAAANPNRLDTVLEVGPGHGEITFPIAQHAQKVVAVEKDKALSRLLSDKIRSERVKNIEIKEGDILKIFPRLHLKHYKLAANIPYYLTSRFLRMILESKNQPDVIVLTIPKEVARRLVARPPNTNLLAIAVQVYGKPSIVSRVPSGCFSPKPKVASAIVKITDISRDFFGSTADELPAKLESIFFKIVKMAFSKKRKNLLNGLKEAFKTPQDLKKALKKANINIGKRPQELSPHDWLKISRNMLI